MTTHTARGGSTLHNAILRAERQPPDLISMRLRDCHNISDLRKRARRRLPDPMFHYLDGGADDEWTLNNNTDAFAKYQLLPHQLQHDLNQIDLSTKVLGQRVEWPVFLSPTAMSRLFHHEAEPAVARAAARSGTMYALSAMATSTIEEISALTTGPKMFQIYVFKDRGLTREFIERCNAANIDTLCLTVDTIIQGNRERDLRTGMTMPPKFSLKSLGSFFLHPHYTTNLLLHRDFDIANVRHRVDALKGGSVTLIEYIHNQFDHGITWDDVAWFREQWDKPLCLKGLQSAADARQAAALGIDGIMVSNHGGRQLEAAPAPVDCIRPLRDAVGDDLDLIVDGGIRRGNHVVKALALGATACSIGRPYLFGLAAGGEAGVDRALQFLRSETERTLGLTGLNRVGDLSERYLFDNQQADR